MATRADNPSLPIGGHRGDHGAFCGGQGWTTGGEKFHVVELLKSSSVVSFRCFITDIRSLRFNIKVVLFQVSLAS